MTRRIVQSVLLLAVLSACGRDKPAESPPQQAVDSPAVADTTRPVVSTPAPTVAPPPAGTGTKAPAQPQRAGGGGQTTPASAQELASAPRLFTVQVGSFLNAATARSVRDRLQRDGVPVWTTTANVDEGEFTRVRVGVTTNTADVRALAEKIRTQYRWPVWLAMVENRSEVPSNMLDATRSYAGGM